MTAGIEVSAKIDDVLFSAAEIDGRGNMQNAHSANRLQRFSKHKKTARLKEACRNKIRDL